MQVGLVVSSCDKFVEEYAEWLKREGHDSDLRNKVAPSIFYLVFGLAGLFWKYTALLGVVLLVKYIIGRIRIKSKVEKEWERIHRMKSILCEPIMINSEFCAGNSRVAPGLFIGSFDESWSMDREIRMRVLENFEAARKGGFGDRVQKDLAAILNDGEYVANRRRLAPREISDSLQVYFFDVALVKEWMAPVAWSQDCWEIICAADRGPEGEISLLPNVVIDARLKKVIQSDLAS